MIRRLAATAAATLLVAVIAPVMASPADAAAYRYWTYWDVRSDTWKFSQVGPGSNRPDDGGVEGWRFAVSQGTASAPAPRLNAADAFTDVCGSTAVKDGRKRVAVVVDFGVPADAPGGETAPSTNVHGTCVSLVPTASGLDALYAAGHSARLDSGMVCGISGYPKRGCGQVVGDSAAEPEPSASSGNGSGTASRKNGSGSTSGKRDGGSASKSGSGTQTARSVTTSASASPSTSASASPSAAASQGGIPSAAPVASGSALPTLVEGAPAADTSGSSDTPWPALIGVALVAAVAGAGAFQVRRRRGA